MKPKATLNPCKSCCCPLNSCVKNLIIICKKNSLFFFFCLPSLIHEVSHGGGMGSISTWHVTLKHRCAGAQGRWTSTPGTIQNSTRQSISASPPTSMDRHTPTRSDYDYTVRPATGTVRQSMTCFSSTHRSCTGTPYISITTLSSSILTCFSYSMLCSNLKWLTKICTA